MQVWYKNRKLSLLFMWLAIKAKLQSTIMWSAKKCGKKNELNKLRQQMQYNKKRTQAKFRTFFAK